MDCPTHTMEASGSGSGMGGDSAPREMAMRGTHDRLVGVLTRVAGGDARGSTLDLGAGQGAMSAKLRDSGWSVSACDLYPEMFRVEGVECRYANAADSLPYEDDSYSAVVASEVVEHLESHGALFSEVARVLRPGGVFIFTTPNILSLKSRLRFLLTGYLYSHGPLDPDVDNPVKQHIAPFSIDRYRFVLARRGLRLECFETDKLQNTSLALAWLVPIIAVCSRLTFGNRENVRQQNSATALFGRKIIVVSRLEAGAGGAGA